MVVINIGARRYCVYYRPVTVAERECARARLGIARLVVATDIAIDRVRIKGISTMQIVAFV